MQCPSCECKDCIRRIAEAFLQVGGRLSALQSTRSHDRRPGGAAVASKAATGAIPKNSGARR